MTIRVEREALLRVISRAPSLPSFSKGKRIEEDEFVIVELPETKQEFPFLIDNTTDDDQASVCSLSTSSVTTASTSDDEEERPRVSFATGFVTDVWTRERTPLEDVSLLFYSSQETQKVGVLLNDFLRAPSRRRPCTGVYEEFGCLFHWKFATHLSLSP
jgi:hypothetical protein